MRLFHGSTKVVELPVILANQRLLDFGKGFYTTTNSVQAENWALVKQKREGVKAKPVVSVYEMDGNMLTSGIYKVKIFSKADAQWLDFIIANRTGTINHNFDIVKGAVANDALYSTLLLFETGVLSKEETIVRLKTHKLFDQLSFHNSQVLEEIKFVESYQVI